VVPIGIAPVVPILAVDLSEILAVDLSEILAGVALQGIAVSEIPAVGAGAMSA
jgi:hypothetical protein